MNVGSISPVITASYHAPQELKPNSADSVQAKAGHPYSEEPKKPELSTPGNTDKKDVKESANGEKSKAKENPQELTDAELKIVEDLKKRDKEVRAHEQAHKAIAGSLARGGPTYSFQAGPDGKRYAVGGEVQIDTSKVPNDPQATIQKANRIQAAALAPAEPSAQDRAVASAATQMAAEARVELAEKQRAENGENSQATGENEKTSNENAESKEHPGIEHPGIAAYKDTENVNRQDSPTLSLVA